MQEIIFDKPTCIDDVYRGMEFKYTWSCSKGHIWKATWSNVYSRKSGCPYCSGHKGTGIDTLKAFAISKNGKCNSNKYKKSYDHYKWMCEFGHTWLATWSNIKRGYWCPHCHERYGTSIETLQAYAKSKNGKCLSQKYINARAKYTWQCSEGHIWDAIWCNVKGKNQWCYNCTVKKNTTIETLKEFAKSKNGKCISLKFKNANDNYNWQCNVCGYVWSTKWSHIKKGTWCRICARNSR